MVKSALAGEDSSSVVSKDGVLAPVVSIGASSPIENGGEVVGAVLIYFDIDHAFVDGVKSATGLDASVYADNIRSATTFLAPDGKSRYTGIKEEKADILERVLVKGELYKGASEILNVSYFASYLPLKDINGVPVGMLFVGRPQVELLKTAGRSIELTFFVTAVLLALSIFPSYLVSRYIVLQIR